MNSSLKNFSLILFVAGVIFGIVLDIKLLDNQSNDSIGKTYVVDICHYDEFTDVENLSCTTETGKLCTLNEKIGDYCERFVRCSDKGVIQKDSEFSACFACFAGKEVNEVSQECLAQFSDHPLAR